MCLHQRFVEIREKRGLGLVCCWGSYETHTEHFVCFFGFYGWGRDETEP